MAGSIQRVTESRAGANVSETLDQLCINTIRTLSIDAVQQANAGHPGAPMGLAPVAQCLVLAQRRNSRAALFAGTHHPCLGSRRSLPYSAA